MKVLKSQLEITIGIRNCVICEYFNPSSEGCEKSNGQRPPAHIIVEGCEQFENSANWEDNIPF